MKEKIKTTCLILLTTSIVVFVSIYTLSALIDIGCSSPKLYSTQETGTSLELFLSRQFFGVKCSIWNRVFQIQQNY